MASKLRAAQAPPAAVVALLLATACLVVFAATVADARPLKHHQPSSSSSEGDDDARVLPTAVVESPAAGEIQTVVGTVGDDGASRNKLVMSIGMLGGIKDSGPSPGAGH